MPDDAKRFRFQRLDVWQEGRKLYGLISRLLKRFPREKMFGLTSQMRRSARSICANIAEGSGRNSDRDFAQFVEIAYGSASEVASDAFLVFDEGYIDEEQLHAVLAQVETVVAKASGLYRKRVVSTDNSGIPRSAFRAPRKSPT